LISAIPISTVLIPAALQTLFVRSSE
jgi:hypothetical protein